MTSSAYIDEIDNAILECDGKRWSLERLLEAVRGADPVTLRDRARSLGINLPAPAQAGAEVERTSPELHALDFEWYFTDRCASYLWERFVSNKASVLLLGAPTVANAAAARGACPSVVLVDRNPLVSQRFPQLAQAMRCICGDARALRFEAAFDVVLFDPPWFRGELEKWIAEASRLLRVGGQLVFSLMPPLLRPDAKLEREQLLSRLRSHGDFVVEESALRYATPFFESEALRHAGVSFPHDWRTADLVHGALHTRFYGPRASLDESFQWSSYLFGSQVVKLRSTTAIPNEEPTVEPLTRDYLYESVTTRDPLRATIDLWTSRSRVARVRRPDIVGEVLAQLSTGISSSRVTALLNIRQDVRERLLNQLSLVLGAERL